MLFRTLSIACLTAVLSTTPAFAQSPAAQAPAPATLPYTSSRPAYTPASPALTPGANVAPRRAPAALPAGTKVNLNTATATELDTLPSVGKARTKVIMDERAKSTFKDWADFDARTKHTSINAGVKAKIKDLATF